MPPNARSPKTFRRAFLRVLLFAAIGAAATVLVAWGFAIRAKPRQQAASDANVAISATLVISDPGWEGFAPTQFAQHRELGVLARRFRQDGFGVSRMLNVRLFGWPAPSMYAANWYRYVHRGQGSGGQYGITLASPPPAQGFGGASSIFTALQGTGAYAPPHLLPTNPVWPGFAVNTAFYAALAFLLWSAPGFARRSSRRRRGRCVRCAYELAGVAVCPECGRSEEPQRGSGL